jgi:hypothetical protein
VIPSWPLLLVVSITERFCLLDVSAGILPRSLDFSVEVFLAQCFVPGKALPSGFQSSSLII